MAGKTIEIRCQGSRMAPLASLEMIQGGLKELTESMYGMLRRRIETKGFDAPLFVWQNKILDGSQRAFVLGQMIAEGWELPDGMVPVCDIEASSLEQAKAHILGYVSQYGTVTEDGLYEFLSGMANPDVESLNLPGFDFEAFRAGFLEDDGPVDDVGPNLNPEIGGGEVTGGDIDRAADRLAQAPATKSLREVTCAKCGKVFMVEA